MLAGVTLNPHTPVCVLEEVIRDIDMVLLMSVNPGFGGQKFITDVLPKIEEIRKQRGIRQDEFAKLMGVSRQTISSLETGRYNPSIFLAYKIAKYFDMTIEEVFIFDEEALK